MPTQGALAQEAGVVFERALALEATQPAESLRLVVAAIDGGIDRWDSHCLHARLLFGTGRAAEARQALAKAQACLVRDQAATEELMRAILRAERAARGGEGGPGNVGASSDASADTPATQPEADPAAELREADRLREQDQLEAAGERYERIARKSTGHARREALDRIVDTVRRLGRRAKSLAPTEVARADDLLAAALRLATGLRDGFGDPLRSMDAIVAISGVGSPQGRERTEAELVKSVADAVDGADKAKAAGDEKGHNEVRDRMHRVVNFDMNWSPGRNRARLLAGVTLCATNDPERRRENLLALRGLAEDLLRQIDEKLNSLDPAGASPIVADLTELVGKLEEFGEHQMAAELRRQLGVLSARAGDSTIDLELQKKAAELTAKGRAAEQRGDLPLAAELLGAAFWNDLDAHDLGFDAAKLLSSSNRALLAMRIYEKLSQAADARVVERARGSMEDLLRQAQTSFAEVREAFEAALDSKQEKVASDLANDVFLLVDEVKWRTIRSGIGKGMKMADNLREMARLLSERDLGARKVEAARAADPASEGQFPVAGVAFRRDTGIRMIPILRSSKATSPSAFSAGEDAAWVSESVVTHAQFEKFSATVGTLRPSGEVAISWNNAVMFCLYLTNLERNAGRLPPGYCYTLPTEAEWESHHREALASSRFPADAPFEWCLEGVDPTGNSLVLLRPDGSPDYSTGRLRICRRLSAQRNRDWRPRDEYVGSQFTFRVVLARRAEFSPPYAYSR